MNISNSLLNGFRDVLNGNACFNAFHKTMITKEYKPYFKDSTLEAMNIGQWFEFMVTGALLRDGKEPQPKRIKSGELGSEYRNMSNLIATAKDTCLSYGNEYGKTLTFELNGFDFKSILDVCNEHENIIRDIKTTGKLTEKYDSFGWALDQMKEDVLLHSKARFQSIMYSWMWFKLFGVIPDFYFDVFCRNGEEAITWYVCYNQAAIDNFEKEILLLCESLSTWLLNPDETDATFDRCRNCPVVNCLDRKLIPDIKVIELR